MSFLRVVNPESHPWSNAHRDRPEDRVEPQCLGEAKGRGEVRFADRQIHRGARRTDVRLCSSIPEPSFTCLGPGGDFGRHTLTGVRNTQHNAFDLGHIGCRSQLDPERVGRCTSANR